MTRKKDEVMQDWYERKYWCKRWVYRQLGIQNLWEILVKIMPKSLKYWVLIDQGVKFIHSDEIVPNVPFTKVLQRSGNACN